MVIYAPKLCIFYDTIAVRPSIFLERHLLVSYSTRTF